MPWYRCLIRGENFPVQVIANRHRRRLFGSGIGKKDAARIFKQSNTVIIEDDWATMNEAVNRGILPIEVHPRSKFVRQVDKIAETVK